MEILSTGEKIKRARVYKGITLKELCRDRISISKMSCIEKMCIRDRYKTVDEVEEGAVVAVPDDPSNEARALRVLAARCV